MRPVPRIIGIGLVLLLVAAPAAAEDRYLDAGGVQLRYSVHGEGEPVVLLHGLSANAEMWNMTPVVPALMEDHRVILLDCRGHGKSGKPHEPARYGREMVEDVVRLLDHLQIEKAHVAGYSMGGMIALKLVVTHPERIYSAVIGGFGWTAGDEEWNTMMERLAAGLDDGTGAAVLMEYLTPEGDAVDEGLRAMMDFALTQMNDPKALAAVVRGFRQLTDVSEAQLRANRVPTLAITGAEDTLAPRVERLSGVMASLEVLLLDGANHMTTPGRPEFTARLVDFVAAHDPRTEPEPERAAVGAPDP